MVFLPTALEHTKKWSFIKNVFLIVCLYALMGWLNGVTKDMDVTSAKQLIKQLYRPNGSGKKVSVAIQMENM